MPTQKLRVLVVDDEAFTQQGLKDYLIRQGMAVNTAHNMADAMHFAVQWSPDVVVMDIAIPANAGEMASLEQSNGLEAARQIKAANPKTGIVFYSAYPYFRPEVLDMVGQGHGGVIYLTKSAHHPNRLKEAIKQAYNGEIMLDSQVNQSHLSKGANLSLTEQETGKVDYAISQMRHLTPREIDIVREAAASRTTAGIAKELGLAPSTVQSSLRQIFSKLGLALDESTILLRKRDLLLKAYHIYQNHYATRR